MCVLIKIFFSERKMLRSALIWEAIVSNRVSRSRFLSENTWIYFLKNIFKKKFNKKIIWEMRRHWTDFHLFKYSNQHLTGNILHFFFLKKKKNLISVESPSASFEHQPNNIGILFLMNSNFCRFSFNLNAKDMQMSL